ncbi:MAG: PD-(D/E)XK nuclease family protein [Candidatus Aenigmarchaeota archaeon]|nr:PD-(D/E)XK nuclease family protein [Candidatus Aenigmarchaeota archaeon]
MAFQLSPSSINLMFECEKCFWLQIVKKVRRPAGIFPSLPSGMDRILKQHFDRFAAKGKLPPELRDNEHTKGIALFSDMDALNVWRNNRKGLTYTDSGTGILLRGAVDNILTKDGKLIVLDYKTRGYPLKDDTHEHYASQMHLYNYLLKQNGHDTEDFALLLFYHPNTVTEAGEVIFNTDLIRMSSNAQEGEKIFQKAIGVLQGEEPDASNNCGFCEFRSNGN